MAEDTAYQKEQKKSNATKTSCAIISTTDLNNEEVVELYNLGALMARMKWMELYTNSSAFEKGAKSQEGVTHEVGNKDDFDSVVLYRTPVGNRMKGPKQPAMVELNDAPRLYKFVAEIAKELLRRGILQ